jgi:rubrerythrin
MSKPMSDSGKGSFRRNEDLNKVNEGFDRIFGPSKLEQRLKKEQEEQAMIDEQHEHEEDDSEWTCDVCGGPMYRQAHWGYAQCDDCGARQELIDDDYL